MEKGTGKEGGECSNLTSGFHKEQNTTETEEESVRPLRKNCGGIVIRG